MSDKRIEIFVKNATSGKVEDFQLYKSFEDITDGYHTFKELYDYRMAYNAAWFNELTKTHPEYDIHKSKRHSDGELCRNTFKLLKTEWSPNLSIIEILT